MPTNDIVINVTDDDICNAVPGNPSQCAIAQAVKREFPEATYINVGRGTIAYTIKSEKKRYKHRTSLKAADAQDKLDKGKNVVAADFPPIRLYLDEADVKPTTFTPEVKAAQNLLRAQTRAGERVVKPMTKRQKAARLKKRRHA